MKQLSFVDSDFKQPICNILISTLKQMNHVNILVNDSDLEPRAIICTHDFKSGYADVT